MCKDVAIEPSLLLVTGEEFVLRSANIEDDSRLDVKSTGFYRQGQTAFFDIRIAHLTVKSGVLFPRMLQHCRQYCNVYVLIAPSKLHRNLQIATISISTYLLISIFSCQIFAEKNASKQYLVAWQHFYQRKSAEKPQKSIKINKFVKIDIVATCKFRCKLLGAISGILRNPDRTRTRTREENPDSGKTRTRARTRV